MKKAILISLCTFLVLSSHSQEVFKFKAWSFKYAALDKNSDFIGSTIWRDTSLIIVVDFRNMKLKIIGGDKDKIYDIIKLIDSWTDADKDDWIKYSCVDPEGLKCHFRTRGFMQNGEKTFDLYIDYSDAVYQYSANKD